MMINLAYTTGNMIYTDSHKFTSMVVERRQHILFCLSQENRICANLHGDCKLYSYGIVPRGGFICHGVFCAFDVEQN